MSKFILLLKEGFLMMIINIVLNSLNFKPITIHIFSCGQVHETKIRQGFTGEL